uniref:Uncharacterized protein n=1 Tax=Cacopsylla melanoneura TaxID=428564 RepID=A0A8D8UWS8_9HEMI
MYFQPNTLNIIKVQIKSSMYFQCFLDRNESTPTTNIINSIRTHPVFPKYKILISKVITITKVLVQTSLSETYNIIVTAQKIRIKLRLFSLSPKTSTILIINVNHWI